ncbi:MAG: hypothetical protein QOE34_1281 [Verrucomicrobiota bacterium]
MDYLLSFSVPFRDVVSQLALLGITGFDENSSLSYVIATATQAHSLNQDLNGVDKNYDGSLSWSLVGVMSNPMTASGISLVPEINPAWWVVLLLVGGGGSALVQQPAAAKARARSRTSPVDSCDHRRRPTPRLPLRVAGIMQPPSRA